MSWIFLHECINSIYDVQYWNNSSLDQIGRFKKMSHHRPKSVLVSNYQTIGMQHLMFQQCGWEYSFTYSEIYMESQNTLNNVLHNVTSQKTRMYITMVADSRSQWENDRSITGVQSALTDFSISYTARLMNLLYVTMHTNVNNAEAKKI